ncbi:MAG TPA: methylmalonyl-CoA epimerase [Candidatus Sumerlaeota bacterium]|nr:MAG: Glyoxalase-like domain protein [candidate division BRC1 bacterium ADurb.BinA292]HOE96661.1 methylmalonyl-CoA epimerase [Candidatus Sumerlaeota bacterium]HOR27676.1 methylmalonyl-CoA epimerase [Candidatus Sumerlaeota bacterium]HPK03109.1 methylmalonyl-CoA epimerase [Candidatus Sumerlaeota bacterium]
MFKQVDHIGIATRDIDASIATLRKLGPLVVGEREVIERYQLQAVMVRTGDVPIELIQPTSSESNIAAFIDKRGEGVHHVAYRVADVAAALKQAEAEGFRLIDQAPRPGYGGSQVAFLHPKSVLGMLTELVQREAGKDEPPYAFEHGH